MEEGKHHQYSYIGVGRGRGSQGHLTQLDLGSYLQKKSNFATWVKTTENFKDP